MKVEVNGFERIVKKIESYRDGLNGKIETAIRRLVDEVGIPVIDQRINEAMGDSDKSHDTLFTISETADGLEGTLTVNGKDIAFIEFGAGIYYNTPAGTSPHPKGEEFGYTIGSYGQGQGRYEIWVYRDANGNRQVSYGTEATMPLYNAAKEMEDRVVKIFREVFSNG